MSERQDPVEWSRDRWIANGQPSPDQFTAMAAILRTHQAMTASQQKLQTNAGAARHGG